MPTKSLYSRKLSGEIAKSAKPFTLRNFHVIRMNESKWGVVKEGSFHTLKTFLNQRGAINFASESALKNTGEVIVHARSGEIKRRISFVQNS